MARSFQYDVVLADIRLPDMTGYDCFCQVRESQQQLPVILMTGFGYDPTHSIVKARQQGLKSVLYKPFRIDQLLDEVEKNVNQHGASDRQPGGLGRDHSSRCQPVVDRSLTVRSPGPHFGRPAHDARSAPAHFSGSRGT